MKINLPKDKHIGLIFEPRSGSHAFRNYISPSLGHLDLKEFLNPHIRPSKFIIDKNKKSLQIIVNQRNGEWLDESDMNTENFDKMVASDWIDTQLATLDDMASIDHFSIFSILIKNTLSYHPTVLEKIKNNPNIFLIRLKRIDVLYGLISLEICKYTNIWHNFNQENTFSRENIKGKLNIPLDVIKDHLEMYIRSEYVIKETFGDIPVIYYEQWQNNIRNLNKILNIPNKILSVDYQKFTGNYKNLISNLAEIENYYKEFVIEHSEYFQDQHIKDILSDSVNEFH